MNIVYAKKSHLRLEELEQKLMRVAGRYGFAVTGIQDIHERTGGVEPPVSIRCRLFGLIDDKRLKEFLRLDMRLSSVIPFRVSVYEEMKGTIVATIYPSVLLRNFLPPFWSEMANGVQNDLLGIIDETVK